MENNINNLFRLRQQAKADKVDKNNEEKAQNSSQQDEQINEVNEQKQFTERGGDLFNAMEYIAMNGKKSVRTRTTRGTKESGKNAPSRRGQRNGNSGRSASGNLSGTTTEKTLLSSFWNPFKPKTELEKLEDEYKAEQKEYNKAKKDLDSTIAEIKSKKDSYNVENDPEFVTGEDTIEKEYNTDIDNLQKQADNIRNAISQCEYNENIDLKKAQNRLEYAQYQLEVSSNYQAKLQELRDLGLELRNAEDAVTKAEQELDKAKLDAMCAGQAYDDNNAKIEENEIKLANLKADISSDGITPLYPDEISRLEEEQEGRKANVEKLKQAKEEKENDIPDKEKELKKAQDTRNEKYDKYQKLSQALMNYEYYGYTVERCQADVAYWQGLVDILGKNGDMNSYKEKLQNELDDIEKEIGKKNQDKKDKIDALKNQLIKKHNDAVDKEYADLLKSQTDYCLAILATMEAIIKQMDALKNEK